VPGHGEGENQGFLLCEFPTKKKKEQKGKRPGPAGAHLASSARDLAKDCLSQHGPEKRCLDFGGRRGVKAHRGRKIQRSFPKLWGGKGGRKRKEKPNSSHSRGEAVSHCFYVCCHRTKTNMKAAILAANAKTISKHPQPIGEKFPGKHTERLTGLKGPSSGDSKEKRSKGKGDFGPSFLFLGALEKEYKKAKKKKQGEPPPRYVEVLTAFSAIGWGKMGGMEKRCVQQIKREKKRFLFGDLKVKKGSGEDSPRTRSHGRKFHYLSH